MNRNDYLSLLLFLLLIGSIQGQSKAVAQILLRGLNSAEDVNLLEKEMPFLSLHVAEYSDESLEQFGISSDNKAAFFRESAFDTVGYKHLESKKRTEHRVSYIYLDGSQLNLKQIDSIRSVILKKYEAGSSFAELANEYTMDFNSKGGDLGWFASGTMVKSFEDAVKKHKKGDIFTLNIPERNWYYVVLKTYTDQERNVHYYVRLKCIEWPFN